MDWDKLSTAIDEYEKENPTMRLDTPSGSRIRFTGNGGYEKENEWAKKLLTAGNVYTLELIDVGSWSSRVWLKEFPMHNFNSVMFQNTDSTESA